MNSTLMDILENLENYNTDQRKIAVKQAIGLLKEINKMKIEPLPDDIIDKILDELIDWTNKFNIPMKATGNDFGKICPTLDYILNGSLSGIRGQKK